MAVVSKLAAVAPGLGPVGAWSVAVACLILSVSSNGAGYQSSSAVLFSFFFEARERAFVHPPDRAISNALGR